MRRGRNLPWAAAGREVADATGGRRSPDAPAAVTAGPRSQPAAARTQDRADRRSPGAGARGNRRRQVRGEESTSCTRECPPATQGPPRAAETQERGRGCQPRDWPTQAGASPSLPCAVSVSERPAAVTTSRNKLMQLPCRVSGTSHKSGQLLRNLRPAATQATRGAGRPFWLREQTFTLKCVTHASTRKESLCRIQEVLRKRGHSHSQIKSTVMVPRSPGKAAHATALAPRSGSGTRSLFSPSGDPWPGFYQHLVKG